MAALPEDYDAWYGTPRGAWIGEVEFRRLYRLLAPGPRAKQPAASRNT